MHRDPGARFSLWNARPRGGRAGDLQETAKKVAARGGSPDIAVAYEILDVHDAIAVVKLRVPPEQDYLLLGRFAGRWLVRHIPWQWHPGRPEPGAVSGDASGLGAPVRR